VAWQRKEALRTWYATTSAAPSARDLDVWIASVTREGPAEMRKALSAFRNWRQEILACIDASFDALEEWLCGKQEQSHQSLDASRLRLP